ncbi:MAG: nuclear transport factor 2 family protein [Lautropia sp.]
MSTSEAERNLSLLERLADRFNAHDLDAIMELFADDCSLDMPRGPDPWGSRYVGKDAVRRGLAMRFETTPDVHYGDVRHFVAGSMGVSEWLLTGTRTDGVRLRVNGCDHYTFRDGMVIRKDSYWKIVE